MPTELPAPDPRPDAEAAFVHSLAAPGGRVLVAGCGSGENAAALGRYGHPVLGIDDDLDLLRAAAELAPDLPFRLTALTDFDIPQAAIGPGFDVVFLTARGLASLRPADLPVALSHLAAALRPGGLLVAGPGPDLRAYAAAADRAGLTSHRRYGDWDGSAHGPDAVHTIDVRLRPESLRQPGRPSWMSFLSRRR